MVLVEAVARMVVQLPTNISVTGQLLAVGVGRLEAVCRRTTWRYSLGSRRTVSEHPATLAPLR